MTCRAEPSSTSGERRLGRQMPTKTPTAAENGNPDLRRPLLAFASPVRPPPSHPPAPDPGGPPSGRGGTPGGGAPLVLDPGHGSAGRVGTPVAVLRGRGSHRDAEPANHAPAARFR